MKGWRNRTIEGDDSKDLFRKDRYSEENYGRSIIE